MAIFAVGANYDGDDVSPQFIAQGVAGVGWDHASAPELHQLMASLKVGDIVYIKAYAPSSPDIIVKGIGFIRDAVFLDGQATNNLVSAGRNVEWRVVEEFRIQKPTERYNVRLNSAYEEFHPAVQAQILSRI
ncbi:MAG TPA: hypothetical protein VHW71_02465 [Steroidobacteraceae bacterium]|nr:hypothetical protein [Steroidobacteraceae bacterium]